MGCVSGHSGPVLPELPRDTPNKGLCSLQFRLLSWVGRPRGPRCPRQCGVQASRWETHGLVVLSHGAGTAGTAEDRSLQSPTAALEGPRVCKAPATPGMTSGSRGRPTDRSPRPSLQNGLRRCPGTPRGWREPCLQSPVLPSPRVPRSQELDALRKCLA